MDITIKLAIGPETAAVTTALKHFAEELSRVPNSSKAYISICNLLVDRIEDELIAVSAKEMLNRTEKNDPFMLQL